MTRVRMAWAAMVVAGCLVGGGVSGLRGATVAFDVPLALPRITALSTQIQAPGGLVEVHLLVAYGADGKLMAAPGSTCDGAPITGSGTEQGKGGVLTYAFRLKNAEPKLSVAISGTLGSGVAACSYAGPKGKVSLPANPVVLTQTAAVAHTALDFTTDAKGGIAGTGTITGAYGAAAGAPGTLKGKLASGTVKWQLTQGRQKLSFAGAVGASTWTGTLTVAVPPDKERISPFTIGLTGAGADEAVFRGAIAMDAGLGPEPADGALVQVHTDRNGDGSVGADEAVSAACDAEGRFQVAMPVVAGRVVVAEASLAGFATVLRTFDSVSPGAEVVVNLTLKEVETLTVVDGTARSSDGRLALAGLPEEVATVSGRVFNPATEAAQFPGEFADDGGNLLVSSVFATAEARDAGGKAVKVLPGETTLTMQVPSDTWGTLRDLTPGNGRIDVPLYSFDEEAGLWRRAASDGWLVGADEAVLAETDLAAIRDGSFDGEVFVTGPIAHLSYWNLDWPIETHACVQGRIVDGTGAAAMAGATVTVSGVTYTGSSSPDITAADGGFCADVMRSEGPGEDLDGDGITGQTQQVQVSVFLAGSYYRFGPFDVPQTQGGCDAGNCLNLGDLRLDAASAVAVQMCTVTGRVVYSGEAVYGDPGLAPGDPIAGASVYGYDPDLGDAFTECLLQGTCQPFAISDSNGTFALTTPVLYGLFIVASKNASGGDPHQLATFIGQVSLDSCPVGPVTVPVDAIVTWMLVAPLQSGGAQVGILSVVGEAASCSLTVGGASYAGTIEPVPALPAAVGEWMTLELMNPLAPLETVPVTFTVDAIQGGSYSGSWLAPALGASGTWSEGFGKSSGRRPWPAP